MYLETIDKFAEAAEKKVSTLKTSKMRYLVASMLAGVYIGLGIMLIYSIGSPFAAAGSPAVKILMGISFGVALTLVVFAGGELFTSCNMIMMIGSLTKRVAWKDTLAIWFWCYLGNLIGSLIFAFAIAKSGLISVDPYASYIAKSAYLKMSAPYEQLFIRAIFCNMLVCLAIWMCYRVKGESAKLLLVFWCLFTFISSGFEHSVANMSLFGMALFSQYDPSHVSWVGFIRNLSVVTLGNMVGGGLFIGAAYYYLSNNETAVKAAKSDSDSEKQELSLNSSK